MPTPEDVRIAVAQLQAELNRPEMKRALSNLLADRHCATCGEREHSSYAKPCCTPDNMIE